MAKPSGLDKALQTLREPAPGVKLVSHGWVQRCRICEKSQHAKWHDYSSGEIINPIALVEWLEAGAYDSIEDFRRAAITYVTFVTTLDMERAKRERSAGNGNPANSGTCV